MSATDLLYLLGTAFAIGYVLHGAARWLDSLGRLFAPWRRLAQRRASRLDRAQRAEERAARLRPPARWERTRSGWRARP